MARRKDDEEEAPPEARGGMMVWVFMGQHGTVPMGVWSSLDAAHKYIHDQQLTGSLTRYEVDVPIYDWAKDNGLFKPKNDQQRSIKFKQTFHNHYQEHYTFKEGHCGALGNPRNFEEQNG
ncbi:MAG TPA: hypothetical protein VEK08_13660 [Planctomycetota bacterium]|nr:hypothetical protein [Planctomycetota bacterium]